MNPEPEKMSSQDKFNAIFGLVMGLLFIAGGVWAHNNEAYQRATLIQTEGIVVDRVSRRERDYNNDGYKETYAPVVEFLVKGDRVRFTGNYDSSRPSNGNSVIVRYDPNQPVTTAKIVHPFQSLTAWGMFGMGGLSIFFSLELLLPVRKWFSRKRS